MTPATFTGTGPNLTIDLNSANEIATFSTDGTTVTVNLTNGTANTGATGGNVTGNGTGTATFSAATYNGLITISDSAAGTSVAFGNSTGSYLPQFNITLNDAASGNITFAGNTAFSQTVTLVTSAGFVASDVGSSVTLSPAPASLVVNAIGHDILFRGALSVSGQTSLSGHVIQADNPANDFVGSLQLTGPVVASIVDANALDLAASTLAFDGLSQTTHITAGGNITQSGALTTTGTGILDLASTGGSIALTDAGNNINANVAIGLSLTGANTATIVNTNTVDLGDVRMGTGLLSVTAAGNIIQLSGTTIDTGGAIACTIGTNNRDVSLFNAGNRIAGPITIAETIAGAIRDVSIRNADDNASLPIGTPMTTPGDIRNLNLFFDNNGMALPGYNISNNLAVTAGGDITQTAALTIPGTTTASVIGDFAINLTTVANNFSGAVSLNAPQSTQPLQVTNSAALAIGASDLGRGSFNATAVTGSITSNAAITQRKGAGLPTFTLTAGNTVSLTGANDFPGQVAFAGAGLTTVNVRNTDFQASVTNITGTLPLTVNNLTMTFDNAAAVLPTLNLNNLTVSALGIVQQPSSALVLGGTGTFSSGIYALNLSNAGNDFNNITVANSGRNDVAVADINALAFSGTSTIGTGRLTVTAAGNITAVGAGRITQANAGPVGDVSLTSTGGTITLNGNNAFRGTLSASVTGANTIGVHNNNVTMVLGNISTDGGAFTADAGTQAITQDPNSVLNFEGTSSFTAGTSVTLTNRASNNFAEPVTLNAANASIRATGPVVLAASNVSGTLSIKTGGSPADSITQTGAITGGNAATFDAGAGDIALTSASNDFGSVSVSVLEAGNVSITDTNALNVGNIVLGGGTLTLTTGGTLGLVNATSGIVQTTGAGAVTLTTPAGFDVNLGSAVNALTGPVTITHSTNVTLQTKGDLTFTPASVITGGFSPTAGGTLTLPPINLAALQAIAATTTVSADMAATGGLLFTGSVDFVGDRTVTSGTGVGFTGDVNAGGALTFSIGNTQNVNFLSGTWNQGANPLTVNGTSATFNIGAVSGDPARFIMTGGTIAMPGGGALTVANTGTLQVGTDAASPETVTVANGAGNLVINGSLAVGFGAVNDQLAKTGDGDVILGTNSHLIGTGLAGVTATPVLATQTELIAGRFANSVDASDNPHDFFAGTDIVTPAYSFIDLTVKAGGVSAPSGTATGFLPDGDKFIVKSSLGGAAGLATVVDTSGNLDVVVRNATAAGASTLTISTTGGGDGQIPVAGLAVHAPGAVSVTAPAANFLGHFTTAGALTSLTARDIGNGAGNSFVLTDGGAATANTSVTARVVSNASFNLAGILKTFKAVSVANGSLTARSFGSLTTTGLVAAGNPGNFNPTLISTTPATGTVVGAATIAGTLGGTWDVRGNIGTVKAFKTNPWTLGTLAGANIHNGGLLGGATSLTLGPVSNTNFNATGRIATMTTSDVTGSDLTAGSFGKLSVVANSALALAGSITNSTFTALGNTAGVALAGLSVAGNMSASALNFLNGNATSITVARLVNNSAITAVENGALGNIASITAGKWQNSSIDARTLGSLKIVGNLPGGLFGDFTGSTVTVRDNNSGLGLGTFSAQGSVSGSTFDVQSGNLTSFLVGRQLGSSVIKLTNPEFGALGMIQAGDWSSGVSVLAKTIGTVASVGAAELFPASPLLLGGIALDTITAYLNGGSVAAIGKLTTKGDFSGSTVLAERGIGSVTVGRAVTLNGATSSFIIADDFLTGAPNVGRIGTLTAGAMTSSSAVANSFGTVKLTGYTQPENPPAINVFGDMTASTLMANGAGGTTPKAAVGIGSLSGRVFQTNSVVKAPFGIKTLTAAGGLLGSSQVVTDNPVAPTAGALGSFTVGEVNNSTVRTGSIATMKVTGYSPLNFIGDIVGSTVAADATATTKTGAQAIQSLTLAGDFQDSTVDAPATVGSISISGRVVSNSAEARVLAGYNTGAKVGSLSAGAWGQTAGTRLADLSAQSVGTLALKGNASRGFAGTADRAFVDILGSSAGVGLGTFSSTGTIANSLFRVSDGDVTSFTTLRFVSSDLLVGFRPVRGSDISLPPSAANWSATNHKIGSFKTTAPFDPADPTDTASFVDSNVVAATLQNVNITGVDPTTTNSTKFGLGFRTPGGGAGSVIVSGVARAPGFSDGQFNFLGLPG